MFGTDLSVSSVHYIVYIVYIYRNRNTLFIQFAVDADDVDIEPCTYLSGRYLLGYKTEHLTIFSRQFCAINTNFRVAYSRDSSLPYLIY